MTRVLIAFDKFKDSLSAREACELAGRALRGRHRDWEFDLCPLADGGDGFAEILTQAVGGELRRFPVAGPRGGLIQAPIGFVDPAKIPAAARRLLDLPEAAGPVAVIEMAAASGLSLLPVAQRDPWQTTSYGTGQLIRIAAETGAGAVVLGIGGSATHDLALGALNALGFEFRTVAGGKLRPPLPSQWDQLDAIEGSLFPSIPPIRMACDVSNPLVGPRGAAAVYAPQKGLKPEDYDRLEAATRRIAEKLCDTCGQPRSLLLTPGGGAAGGTSFGFMTATGARLLPGADLVYAWLDIERRLEIAQVVVTGEGRFDESSLEGEGPGALATRARAEGKPVHVFAGQVTARTTDPQLFLHPITPDGTPLAEALQKAGANLATAIQHAF